MTNYAHFQTQITTIMEIMTKSAIVEMTKLFDDSSSVLCLKISRSLHENQALKRKLQLLQQELRTARRQKEGIAGARESPVNTRSVGVQVFESNVEEPYRERILWQGWNYSLSRDGEPAGVEQSASTEKVRPEPVLIKEETPEGDLCYRDHTPETEKRVTLPTPVKDWKKLDTEPTPAGDPEELSEPHRCDEHGDEELSGLEFVVKPEQEEEHVAQRLNQTGCERSTGRPNNIDSEHVMYERELWTSFTEEDIEIETDDPVCSYATEQCSQNIAINTGLQHTPANMEVSGNTLSSFGASSVEEFDKMREKPSVSSEELRSEAIHTQQGQYIERLVHTVERENQTLLPQQQQHGPSVKHMRGSESPAQPRSGSQYETSSTLSTSVFSAGNDGKADGQANCGRKPFICIYCGKNFDCYSRLISHHRIHTGEKPFSCTQCGKCFNRKSNLVQHERVHSGNKPFGCTLCGKRFAHGPDLKGHHRIHTGEKPYSCTQCGKRFSCKGNLVQHERVHSGNKPFVCTLCGKRFARAPDLRAHHRIHTGEKPYHCTYCGKSFARQSNLYVHRRIHTRLKPYSCI